MEINKDDCKCKHEFFQKKSPDSFIHGYITPQLYLDTNSQTSYLFQVFKVRCSCQNFPNINNFVNRVAIAKTRSTTCKLVKWDNVPLEHRTCQMCSLAWLESEPHFLFYCRSSNHLRENTYG